MPRLVDLSVKALLDAFSSSAPTPGGGSASGLVASIGCALLIMVASLAKSRSGSEDERRVLAHRAGELGPIRDTLADLIDRDSQAYDRVVQAYRLPKTTEGEKSARSATIQSALKGATEVPLEVMRQSVAATLAAVDIARCGHRAAVSDVAVALELLEAGVRGAALNVRINLEGLADRSFAEQAEGEAVSLEAEERQAASLGRDHLNDQ